MPRTGKRNVQASYICRAACACTETAITLMDWSNIQNGEFVRWLCMASIIASNGPWKYNSIEWCIRWRERAERQRHISSIAKSKKNIVSISVWDWDSGHSRAHSQNAISTTHDQIPIRSICEPHRWSSVMVYWLSLRMHGASIHSSLKCYVFIFVWP